MSRINFDLEDLYKRAFGIDPQSYSVSAQTDINEDGTSLNNSFKGQYGNFIVNYKNGKTEKTGPYKTSANSSESANSGSTIRQKNEKNNRDIWLPTRFRGLDRNLSKDGELLLPYTVIKITGKKTIVKTPLSERGGTVKELYSIDDYVIDIKGFLIDETNRTWPDDEIKKLQQLFVFNKAIELDNALTNHFLNPDGDIHNRVVIESFELPEVEGSSIHIRPFSMVLESDSVFELRIDTSSEAQKARDNASLEKIKGYLA